MERKVGAPGLQCPGRDSDWFVYSVLISGSRQHNSPAFEASLVATLRPLLVCRRNWTLNARVRDSFRATTCWRRRPLRERRNAKFLRFGVCRRGKSWSGAESRWRRWRPGSKTCKNCSTRKWSCRGEIVYSPRRPRGCRCPAIRFCRRFRRTHLSVPRFFCAGTECSGTDTNLNECLQLKIWPFAYFVGVETVVWESGVRTCSFSFCSLACVHMRWQCESRYIFWILECLRHVAYLICGTRCFFLQSL